jgi:hypothetical protein
MSHFKFKKWSVDERNRLIEEHKQGKSIEEIAKLHDQKTVTITPGLNIMDACQIFRKMIYNSFAYHN